MAGLEHITSRWESENEFFINLIFVCMYVCIYTFCNENAVVVRRYGESNTSISEEEMDGSGKLGNRGGYQSVAMADKSREPSLLFLLNSIAERIKKLFFRAFVEGVLK